tara:strand:+ start:963 stop:1331 length:369 start_codon:yes stop_codon:yes gene_type:complete
MTFINIAMPVVNGFTSMMRNMYLLSSIGFTVLGFSSSFKEYKYYVRLVGYCIFIYSIIYGLITAADFNNYLKLIETQTHLDNKDKNLLNNWYKYDILAYIYCIMLLVILIIVIRDDILKKFK